MPCKYFLMYILGALYGATAQAAIKPVHELSMRSPQANVKIVGLVPAHNESNIIQQCLQALSLITDAIIYLDDASDDNSLEIVNSLQKTCNIESILHKDTWHRDEPADRNALLTEGRRIGGTHFIVIDADELFSANCTEGQLLKRMISLLSPGESLQVNWIQLWRSIDFYRFDKSVWTWNYKGVVFADDKTSVYSSKFIHTPRIPKSLTGDVFRLEGYTYGLLHFQFVNWQNLLIKQAWYRCLEHIRDPKKSCKAINERYRPSKDETNLHVEPSPKEWFAAYHFFDESVYHLPVKWREKHIKEWFEKYTQKYFSDLEIWDIDWKKIIERN